MKLENLLKEKLSQIHTRCNLLCKNALRTYLPVAGNIAVFAQSNEEFEMLEKMKQAIVEPSENPDQKYFKLKEPVIFPENGDIPLTTYTHLYVRGFDTSPYGKHIGDVDFVISKEELEQLIKQTESKEAPYSMKVYEQKGFRFIEISERPEDAVAYICTQEIAEAMRTR